MNYLKKLTCVDDYLKERGYSLDSFYAVSIGNYNLTLYGEIKDINPVKLKSRHIAMWDSDERIFHKFIFDVAKVEVILILSTEKV